MNSKPAEVVLEYRRVAELSTGQIYVRGDHGERIDPVLFENARFDTMLYTLASTLKEYPDDTAVTLVRTDRSGCVPYKIDQGTLELLRTDPVATVQAFCFIGSPSSVVQRVQAERQPSIPVLRTGIDVLADAFGDLVYARVLGDDIECPGCGFWSPAQEGLFRCQKRCQVELAMTVSGPWAAVAVVDLLNAPLDKFFLPRAWNQAYWIDRGLLARMYTEYLLEREAALCSTMQPAI